MVFWEVLISQVFLDILEHGSSRMMLCYDVVFEYERRKSTSRSTVSYTFPYCPLLWATSIPGSIVSGGLKDRFG